MTRLTGRRVLVVEDEALVAMLVEDALLDAGAAVVGPAATVTEALSLLTKETPDVAVLDLNLAGETSTPVADALALRGPRPRAALRQIAMGALVVLKHRANVGRLLKGTEPRIVGKK